MTPSPQGLHPVLTHDLVVKSPDGDPVHVWGTAEVAKTFFCRRPSWFNALRHEGKLDDALLPPTSTANGGRLTRRWTLVHVEAVAFHLHTTMPHFDTADLLRTLAVVYAVAELHDMLTPQDGLIEEFRRATAA